MGAINTKTKKLENKEGIIIVFIDGIICAGKTTAGKQIVEDLNAMGISAVFVEEPLKEWKKLNYPEKFYANMKKYAYNFQKITSSTRLQSLKKAIDENPKAKIFVVDRSLYADSIFAKTLRNGGFVTEEDYAEYKVWRDDWKVPLGAYNIQAVVPVFLNTSPTVAMERKANRADSYENGVSIEYQQMLYDLHVNYLPKRIGMTPFVIEGDVNFKSDPIVRKQMHERLLKIKDQVLETVGGKNPLNFAIIA
jgi:deoxyadenosine/deoxycytidine kinase